MKRILQILKYSIAFALFIFLCLVPFGDETVLAPEHKVPSYLLAGDSKADEKVETATKAPEPKIVPRVSSSQEQIRFLLLGSDEREDEASRTDTIILATYFPNEGKMNLLSIPRDTQVWIPGQPKQDKINAAHAFGGMELIKETVESWSGLSIDHVAKVNFNGFTELIDGVGGVTVSPQRAFAYGGDSFSLGEQTIDGEQALNYVRFRKDQDGDFGRIKRQQEVIQNTVKGILSDFNVTAIPSYFKFYTEHVDTDMSLYDLTDVARKASANGVTMEAKTLPTTSLQLDGIWFEQASASSTYQALSWLEDQPDEIVSEPAQELSNPIEKIKPRATGPQEV